jgi:P27 family predicted phage terminase small subunit
MAGRKNKPLALHILNGNPSKLDLKEKIKNEPKPKKALLVCPAYLAEDKIAFNEWNRIVPELYKLGLLTTVDQEALELLCSQYSIYRQAIATIQEEGLTTNNIRDGFKAIPEVAIAREAAKTIKALCVEFGLTPSSRGRISIPGEEDPDKELADILD